MQIGKAGSDPRMLFSWYSADYTTDADVPVDATPEQFANPISPVPRRARPSTRVGFWPASSRAGGRCRLIPTVPTAATST
jgi:hypothetical protein